MIKTLTKHGNSLALVIEKPILELINADADTLFDISTDGQVLTWTVDLPAQLGVGIDDGGRMDGGLPTGADGCVAHLSTIRAMKSASATSWSSTKAMPCILHVWRRNWTISSSNTRVSPGVTGRLHFTLSMVMK